MKRVITICLLVVSIFVGGMNVDSKTTKKKNKAKTTRTTSSSKINKLLNEYEEAIDILSSWYNPDCQCVEWGGYLGSQASKQEEQLYKQLKKYESSMSSEQKAKFNKLSHSLNLR